MIANDEIDGMLLSWDDGRPYPAPSAYAMGTPPSTEVLALAPAQRYSQQDTTFGAMTIYTQGGTVFTGSYRRYGIELATNPPLAQLTRNVIAHLRTRAALGVPVTLSTTVRSFPNPFLSGFNVEFTTDRDAPAHLMLYDVRGRILGTLDAWWPRGTNRFRWEGKGTPPGVYFWRLEAGGTTASGKAVRN